MGIWIRTQDKEELVEVCAIEIDEDNENEIIGTTVSQDFYILGRYSERWKIIKVLNMINDHINDLKYNFKNRVFIMPADEEIYQ